MLLSLQIFIQVFLPVQAMEKNELRGWEKQTLFLNSSTAHGLKGMNEFVDNSQKLCPTHVKDYIFLYFPIFSGDLILQ